MEPAKLILPTTSLWTWKRWRVGIWRLSQRGRSTLSWPIRRISFSRESGWTPTTTQLEKRREQRRVRKTEDEWNAYKEENGLPDDSKKKKNIWNTEQFTAKKYCVKTDYGVWDSEFTMETLKSLSANTIKTQRRRDDDYVLWSMEDNGVERTYGDKFKQVRMIIWSKSNPQPLNSSELSNELPWNCLGRN
jgi:hypothetical protein